MWQKNWWAWLTIENKYYSTKENTMTQLTQRNILVLKIIVDEYIQTWEVIWSKWLLKKYDIWVSPATIRSDMAKLEELQLVFQPYNSSGRKPTSKGLRAFVNYLMADIPDRFLDTNNHEIESENTKKIEDFVHNLCYWLSQKTREISFFLLEEKSILNYTGIANFLENNYENLWPEIYQIIRMLEDRKSFWNFINSLNIENNVSVYIGEENVVSFLHKYTLIVKKVRLDGQDWYIWIIGSLKMDYNFNISAVKWII